MAPLLGYLRGLGVVPPAAARVPVGAVEVLLGDYREYLAVERGLTADTIEGYVLAVRPFLDGRVRDARRARSGWAGRGGRRGVRRCPVPAAVKRGGEDDGDRLAVIAAVPASRAVWSAARWLTRCRRRRRGGCRGCRARLSLSSCKRCLTRAIAERASGRRDFAVLVMLARLGLRAGEVAALRIEDVDWRAGELRIVGKGRRDERLPLPEDVGEAIVAYLQAGRPATALDRSLFVRVRAPHHGLTTGGVTQIVVAAAAACWARADPRASAAPYRGHADAAGRREP